MPGGDYIGEKQPGPFAPGPARETRPACAGGALRRNQEPDDAEKVNHPSPLDDAGLRETLAGRGQRFTRQRAAVYRCLTRQAAHPTAEALYREALEEVPNISR
ncbi:MAG: transcriptional repressor, partial [Nitrospinota bacterium]